MEIRNEIMGVCCLTGLVVLAACSSEAPANYEPHVSTLPATDISRTEGTLQGEVTVEGETALPVLVFSYGTDGRMDRSSGPLAAGSRTASYKLTGLTAGTTYYYRLQGVNGRTTIPGNVQTFTTLPNQMPTIGSLSLFCQGPTSVIVGFHVLDDGGEPVFETGCYWALAGDSVRNHVKVDGYQGALGLQRIRLHSLQRTTAYQIWPYAKNRVGETLGERMDLTTGDAVILEKAGQLDALLGDDRYGYTTLSIAGPLNGDDLKCIRQMAGRNTDDTPTEGRLTDIDMTEVHIVSGGGSYGSFRYTEDGVVGQGLFAHCDKLTRIILPADAVKIEKDAFMDCMSLVTLEIPASVTSVLPSSGCTALKNIQVSGANPHYQSQDGVLLTGDGKEIIWFPVGKTGDYVLPATVTAVGDYAFKGCSVSRFTFPDGLSVIGQGAFMDSGVEEVSMPANLKHIPTGTFQGCRQLKTVRLGVKTELLSAYVFDGCPLTDIYLSAVYPPVCESNTFTTQGDAFTTTCVVHVPKGRKPAYRSSRYWSMFTHIVEEP